MSPDPSPAPAKPADSLLPAVRNVPYVPPVSRRCQDVNCLSRQLREGMTEAEVLTTFGYRPETVELGTCGQKATPVHGAARLTDMGSWENSVKFL